jgi:hypothetical protein
MNSSQHNVVLVLVALVLQTAMLVLSAYNYASAETIAYLFGGEASPACFSYRSVSHYKLHAAFSCILMLGCIAAVLLHVFGRRLFSSKAVLVVGVVTPFAVLVLPIFEGCASR